MIGYKLARPDGWDYYTGHTIQYRSPDGKYPHRVVVPRANAALGVCSEGVGHASNKPNDCFVGARIPCSAYRIEAQRVCGTDAKWGWLEADVLEEITDLGKLFGWRYSEAVAPVNPLALPRREPDAGDLEHLCVWASVRDSVWASVWASVRDSVWDSVWASVGDSVRDSVGAYIGHLFPAIKEWKGAPLVQGYPFQSAVDLWMRGLVPSYDGKLWRLHSGPKAEIVLMEAERQYRWERDPTWEMLTPESTYRCRYLAGRPLVRCPKRAVAQMDRSFRPDYPVWWAYCEDHLYGRRIEGGVVMRRILVGAEELK